MNGYVIEPRTLAPIAYLNIVSYNLPIETMQGVYGSATIAGKPDADYNNYALKIEGIDSWFKIVGYDTGDDNMTTLTLDDNIGLFAHCKYGLFYRVAEEADAPTSMGLGDIATSDNATMTSTSISGSGGVTTSEFSNFVPDKIGMTYCGRHWYERPAERWHYASNYSDSHLRFGRLFDALPQSVLNKDVSVLSGDNLYSNYVDLDLAFKAFRNQGAKIKISLGKELVGTAIINLPSGLTLIKYGNKYYKISGTESGGFSPPNYKTTLYNGTTEGYTIIYTDTEPTLSGSVYKIPLNTIYTDSAMINVSGNEVSALLVDISPFGYDIAEQIIFDDGHSTLISETYQSDIVSHVRAYPTGSTSPSITNYYLNASGETTTNKNQQIQGDFRLVSYDPEETTALETAQNIFAENTKEHKIEFYSDKELHIGQPIRVLTSRGILETAISEVMLESGDERFRYVCGELPTTATENIKANSWKYGNRLPTNPRKGQYFILT